MKNKKLFSLDTKLMVLIAVVILISCQKKERFPYLPTWIDGKVQNIGDTTSFIPNARIHLMELQYEGGNGINASPQQFDVWSLIDSTVSDKNGLFRIDYEYKEDNLYGLYSQSPNHFKLKNIQVIPDGLLEKESAIIATLFPKSYLELTVIDEFPTADIDSMWILTAFPASSIKSIFPNDIDTTITIEVLGGEGFIWEHVYWDNGEATRKYENISCPIYETCEFAISL